MHVHSMACFDLMVVCKGFCCLFLPCPSAECHVVTQVGLQGVDNGSIRFAGLRVPRDNLLDRFASVDRSGNYSSPFSPGRRFGATLGELTGGRVGLCSSSLGVLKVWS